MGRKQFVSLAFGRQIAFYLLLIFTKAIIAVADESSEYVLPYAQNSKYKLLQGYNGPWGHEGHCAFAYDFQMPVGTPVHAARSGKVVHIEKQFKDATRKPGEENVIVVMHEDGTYGRYYHLTQNGVNVSVGDAVKQNQLIGASGDSGASAGPHLHFDVTKDCFEWGCQTIKIIFQNTKDNPLKAGEKY
ncbi:MAG TPA: M23 family metallopeptidase [Acidobacteriota bacterium]|nr:M23 family metallopeptidase [Acidobacteriota bacterium]